MESLPVLPRRDKDSHKGTFGHVLLIGGSFGMCGAIALAAKGALRAGAGKVTVATPAKCASIVAGFDPCIMTRACPEDADGRLGRTALASLADILPNATCVVIGPGLGQSPGLKTLVNTLFRDYSGLSVFDADALNLLAQRDGKAGPPAGPRILTPHPGEFRRLTGDPSLTVSECRSQAASLARTLGSIVVFKSNRSIVTDGLREFVNFTGNPGMATAGSGDVLSGVIAGLCGQGLEPFDAASLGVYLHGLAGDLAAAELGQEPLIATDIIDFLPRAFKAYRSDS